MTTVDQTYTRAGLALGAALHQLALDALARGVGQAMPTNAQYLSEHQLGAGTIQRALGFLAERDALGITSHGHQGRRVQSMDVGRLWQLGGLAPVSVAMPPEGPEEIDRLQTALAQGLTDLGIPHMMHHLRGGVLRLAAVQRGEHDISVTSARAAQEANAGVAHGLPASLVRTLGPGTFYGPGSLVSVRRTGAVPARQQRVAIDPDSPDHVALTRAEFPLGEGTTYVEIAFTSVPAAVLRNEVEVGIWHRQESIIPLELAGLSTSPLTRREAIQTWESLSNAVLTGWTGRPELAAVLAALDLASD